MCYPTEKLFRSLELENITLLWDNLSPKYLGVYSCDSNQLMRRYIVLDHSLSTNERLLRCVLAHELGHHFKTAGQCFVAASHTGRMYLSKAEHIATRWAVNLLVDGGKFLQCIEKGYTLQELADYFYVTLEFVRQKAKFIWNNGVCDKRVRKICLEGVAVV